MKKWNAEQYLLFKNGRTQPAWDLASQIDLDQPASILDIGCGPGNSTDVLARRYPGADILGIDNSEEMIAAASAKSPHLRFQILDARKDLAKLEQTYDVIFSNACIQWIPNHERLIKELMSLLRSGGVLAIQVPMIWEEPLHKELKALAASEKWSGLMHVEECFHHLRYEEYYDVLAENSADFCAWETVYLHRMPSHEAILEWYRGTGMLPYLSALPEEKRTAFEEDYLNRLKTIYPVQKNGEILFRFPRFFFVAKSVD